MPDRGRSATDALLTGTGETERACFLDQFRNAFDALLRILPGNEIAQSPDDLARADCLFGGAVERRFDFRCIGVGLLRQKPARTFHVVADGRKAAD